MSTPTTPAEWAVLFARDLSDGCEDEMLGSRVSVPPEPNVERAEPTAYTSGGYYVQAWIFVDDIEVEAAEKGDSDVDDA